MNRKNGYVACFFAAALVLSGCAGMSKEAGFNAVRQQVNERIGYRIQWNQGTAADLEANRAVREVLDKPLTPDAAVQIALLNNRRLQATYEALGIAQAAIVEAGLLKNPIFHGITTFGLSDAEMTAESGHNNDYRFEVEMDFLSMLYAPMRKLVATAAFEAAKIRVTAAVMDAAYGTRGAFYRFQADQQMLEMFQQVALATGAAYEFAQQLYEAGNIPEVDLLLQKASSGQAKLSLAAAEVALAESRERLNAWLGLWGEDTAWTVEARLPDVPADMMAMENLEKRAIENSINLALARQEIVSIGQRLGLLNATQLVPRLDVSAEIEREEREWEAGPGLGVEIPLFDRNQGNRAATRAELRRLKLEYYALAVEIRAAVRAAQRRLLTARQTALFYRDEVLPLQGKIVEQTQLQYNAMQVGAFRLLQAKQQEIDAGRGYIQSLYNYHIAQAELEQILNGRLVARTSTTQLMVSGTSESSLTPEEGAH